MTTIDLGSDDPVDPLHQALATFTVAVGDAVSDICSYGLTVGETYVPFDPDEDEDCTEEDINCSQVWVRVAGIAPKQLGDQGWDGDCAIVLNVEIEVGVLRCFVIPEGGEAPTTTEVLSAALQSMTDMRNILDAALSTEVWDAIDIGSWNPVGPAGGQYGGTWSFTAEFSGIACSFGDSA